MIQDTEDGDPEDQVIQNPDSERSNDRPNFKIESMQYEGGDDDGLAVGSFDPHKYKQAQQ